MKILTRTVVILSIVSLFADVASEMLYPVIPLYLKEIGFTVLWIGILEGIAEFTAGISKGYFGKLSDEKGVRLPFIKLGYFLSAISKPMLAAFTAKLWIFFSRTTDRLGKGLRTAARDALLSQEATPQTKARVFGFHRGMDTLGAMLGPIAALVFLFFYPAQYKTIFLVAFIPGIISVLLVFLLREEKRPVATIKSGNFFSFLKYWKIASTEYRKMVSGLVIFALFNSSDIFLLLKTAEITANETFVFAGRTLDSSMFTIAAYIFYNLIYAAFSYPLGSLADKIGLRRVVILGLFVFVLVYAGFAFASSFYVVLVLFFLYGIYAAATEGIIKAWITNLAHDSNTATAVGFYTSVQSVCSLLASIIAGFIWVTFGSSATFAITAGITASIIVYFLVVFRKS